MADIPSFKNLCVILQYLVAGDERYFVIIGQVHVFDYPAYCHFMNGCYPLMFGCYPLSMQKRTSNWLPQFSIQKSKLLSGLLDISIGNPDEPEAIKETSN
jgi:hypothetical protein